MSIDREAWDPIRVAELRTFLAGALADVPDAHVEELYEEFSGDVYAAGWMMPNERTAANFLKWLAPPGGVTRGRRLEEAEVVT